MKKSELIFGLLRIPVDFLVVWGVLVLAYWVRLYWSPFLPVMEGVVPPGFEEYWRVGVGAAGVFILVMMLVGGYGMERVERYGRQVRDVFVGTFVWVGVVMTLMFFLRGEFFSRLIVLYSVVGVLVCVSLGRLVLGAVFYLLRRWGWEKERVLILGTNKVAAEVEGLLRKEAGVKVVGALKMGGGFLRRSQVKTLGGMGKLEEVVREFGVDEIILTEELPKEDEGLNLIEFCHVWGVRFRMAPSTLELQRVNVETDWLGAIPLVEMKATALDGWGRVVKRGIDIFGAGVGLVVLSPVLLAVSLAIKLDSRGPVFFSRLPDGSRVKRVGRGGELINFLKFRSMRDNSHDERYGELAEKSHRKGPLVKIKNDPRVTRVGAFIRRWSVDELPQLWNVLTGELSLVGPRAHLPEEVKKYQTVQRRVLSIKPGITGQAQVSGRSDLEFEEEVRLDLWYIENWSVWLDVKILAKTVWVVLGGGGAD